MPTHYQTLNIPPSASTSTIKTVFRKIILANHPDKTKSLSPADRAASDEKAKAANNAWECLRDAAERAKYDAKLAQDVREQAAREQAAREQAARARTRSSQGTTWVPWEVYNSHAEYQADQEEQFRKVVSMVEKMRKAEQELAAQAARRREQVERDKEKARKAAAAAEEVKRRHAKEKEEAEKEMRELEAEAKRVDEAWDKYRRETFDADLYQACVEADKARREQEASEKEVRGSEEEAKAKEKARAKETKRNEAYEKWFRRTYNTGSFQDAEDEEEPNEERTRHAKRKRSPTPDEEEDTEAKSPQNPKKPRTGDSSYISQKMGFVMQDWHFAITVPDRYDMVGNIRDTTVQNTHDSTVTVKFWVKRNMNKGRAYVEREEARLRAAKEAHARNEELFGAGDTPLEAFLEENSELGAKQFKLDVWNTPGNRKVTMISSLFKHEMRETDQLIVVEITLAAPERSAPMPSNPNVWSFSFDAETRHQAPEGSWYKGTRLVFTEAAPPNGVRDWNKMTLRQKQKSPVQTGDFDIPSPAPEFTLQGNWDLNRLSVLDVGEGYCQAVQCGDVKWWRAMTIAFALPSETSAYEGA